MDKYNIILGLMIGGLLMLIISHLAVVKILKDKNEILENQPILNSDFVSWNDDNNNPDKVIYDLWIYNFGNTEAKNVKLKCFVFLNETVMDYTIEDIGNVASNQDSFKEIVVNKKPAHYLNDTTSICLIDSCENDCKILWKGLPRLVEIYNK